MKDAKRTAENVGKIAGNMKKVAKFARGNWREIGQIGLSVGFAILMAIGVTWLQTSDCDVSYAVIMAVIPGLGYGLMLGYTLSKDDDFTTICGKEVAHSVIIILMFVIVCAIVALGCFVVAEKFFDLAKEDICTKASGVWGIYFGICFVALCVARIMRKALK